MTAKSRKLSIGTQRRVLAWKKVRGLWKDRKPNSTKKLERMRPEWANKKVYE